MAKTITTQNNRMERANAIVTAARIFDFEAAADLLASAHTLGPRKQGWIKAVNATRALVAGESTDGGREWAYIQGSIWLASNA